MLIWRIVSASLIIFVLVIVCWLDYHLNLGRPGIWLLVVCVAICSIATIELTHLLSLKEQNGSEAIIHFGTLCVYMPPILPLVWHGPRVGIDAFQMEWSLLGVLVALTFLFVREIIRFRDPGAVMSRISLSLFAIVYVGLFGSFLAALRTFQGNEWGMLSLLSMIVVVKSADIGAYTVGHLFGKHKLAPRLSPGKTIEGTIGGLLAGCLGSWLILVVFSAHFAPGKFPPLPVANWVAYGLIVSCAGTIGDLAESLIKRARDQKDSGKWLPGLGGMLDLIDSMVLAAPVAYICWYFHLVGP